MDAQTTVTVRCIACGKLGEVRPSCGCGANFEYISPGELAAKALKADSSKSNRAIAGDLGVDESTVRKARKATAGNPAVGKRTGKDGKTRRMPRKPPAPPRGAEAVIALADQGLSTKDIAAQTGVSERQARRAIEEEQLIRKGQADPVIDPATLPKTAREKLAIALRQQQRQERAEFERRVAAEYSARVQKTFPELEKMEREAREEKRLYERLRRETKTPMTMAEYTLVCSLLHPDSRESASREKLMRAFQMFEPKVFALTGEVKKNAQSTDRNR